MFAMLVGAGIGALALAVLGGILASQVEGISMPIGIVGGAALGAIVGMAIGTRAQ